MVDITEQNNSPTVTQDSNVPAQAAAMASNQPEKSQKPLQRETSKGEKIYNWTVYSGLNYWVNLLGSIAIADYFTHLGGRGHLDKAIVNTAKSISASKMTTTRSAFHYSKTAWETLALTSGGWALLAPMKYMEDRKRPIVRWLNEKLGVDQTGADGHKLAADEIYIEKEQPKQSWTNVIKRRLLACVAIIGSSIAIEKTFASRSKKRVDTYEVPGMDKWSEERFIGGREVITETVRKYFNWGASKLPGGKAVVKSPRTQRWLGLGILDTFFTKISAVVMLITNGAKPKHMPREVEEPSPLPTPAQPAIMETQLPPAIPEKKWAKETPQLAHAERVLAEPQESLQPGIR